MALSSDAQARARGFLRDQARPLEWRRYQHRFEDGSAAAVVEALAPFANPDGGFGHGLEPDLRTRASTVIATTVGLQVLAEIGAPADEPLVTGAVGYLLATYDADHLAWPLVGPQVEQAPHAPWWSWSDDVAAGWNGFRFNPTAEVLGHLYTWQELAPAALLNTLGSKVLADVEAQPDPFEVHDWACCLRLLRSPRLPAALRDRLAPRLTQAAAAMPVALDPAEWSGYVTKPLNVADSPDLPWYPQFADSVARQLAWEAEQQQPDGSWSPTWSWPGEAWAQARQEWSGVLTLERLEQAARLASDRH